MNIKEKLKKIFSHESSNKFVPNLLVVLCIGVIILIGVSSFTKDKEDNRSILEPTHSEDMVQQGSIGAYSEEIEGKLENILCKIKGVGIVDVMVTLEDTAEKIPAFNTTQSDETTKEKDSEGGTRDITKENSSNQVVTSNSNTNPLIVLKEIKPKVRGVIVVAEGAEDVTVKEQLYSAVKTVLGISGNKVEIYPSN